MLCFPMICGSGRSKSGLANAAGVEATVLTKHEKLHAALARSAFSTQNAKKLMGSDRF